MKLRQPDTIEDVVKVAIALLGEARCCEVVGRRPSQVKAWSDPDDDKRSIPMRACVVLDRELLRCGHEPIFTRYLTAAVAPVVPEAAADGATPLDHAMRVMGEAADMLEETAAACRDRMVDAGERQRLVGRIVSLTQRLGQVKRSLFAKSQPASRAV